MSEKSLQPPVYDVLRPLCVDTLRPLGTASDYAALHGLLRARREALGLSYDTLDEISGLGYCDQILAPMPGGQARGSNGRRARARNIGPVAWGPLLGALGLKLIVAEDIAATARLKSRTAYVQRSSHCVTAKRLSLEDVVQQRLDEAVRQRGAELVREHARHIGRIGGKRSLETMTTEQRRRRARKARRAQLRMARQSRQGPHPSLPG